MVVDMSMLVIEDMDFLQVLAERFNGLEDSPSITRCLPSFLEGVLSLSNHSPTTPHHSEKAISKLSSVPRNAAATPQALGFSCILSKSPSLTVTRPAKYRSISGGGGISVSEAKRVRNEWR